MEPHEILGEKIADIEYHVRPGAYAVILGKEEENTRIGLIEVQVHQSGEKKYYLVGGGIEECDQQEYLYTLKREVIEEIGYASCEEVFVMRIDEYFFSPHMKQHIKKEGYFYHICLGEKQSDPIEQDHNLVWLSPEEAYAKVHHLCAKKMIEPFLSENVDKNAGRGV